MTTRLNIDLLRSFVAIAEARVMSRAASRVGRTQAALSQQVKRLETEVQQTLMIRSGRGITLTAQGERLFLHAQNILRTHDEAVGELLGLSLSGELRVGCPDDYAHAFLLSDPDTLDHQAATSGLERAGRNYRIAYASGSISGLTAVVRSGQAIAVLTQNAVPHDLYVLPPSTGLPPLPSIGITVKTGRRSSQLLRSFESHVRAKLPTL